jgi:hypothetical protein
VVLYDGRKPVVIDAKFRLPKFFYNIVESRAVAEIQAYLDEFSLPSAVIVVPLIPGVLNGSMGPFEIIQGREHPAAKAICVVEMPSFNDERFQGNIVKAINFCAQMTN